MREHLRRELHHLAQSHPNIAHELERQFSGNAAGVGGAGAADGQPQNEDGFIYGAAFGTINAGQQSSQPIVIDALSEFRMDQIVGYAEPNGQAAPILDGWVPQLSLNIFDGSERRSLLSLALPWGAVIGTGRLPFIPSVRRVWARNQTLTVQLTNFGGINYNNVFLGFVGANIYPDDGRRGGG